MNKFIKEMAPMSLLSTAKLVCSETGFPDYLAALCGHPKPHQYREHPQLVHFEERGHQHSIQTIVIPTFNHADCVTACLVGLSQSISLPTDVVIIDDASTDDTIKKIKEFLPIFMSAEGVVRFLLLANRLPVYETACDNVGFFVADTEYIVEVQADIVIRQPEFDRQYQLILNSNLNPASIGGRCGHGYGALIDEILKCHHDDEASYVGLTGRKINDADITPWGGYIYQCDTVNRGPWMLKKSDLLRLNYLDEVNFFLGFDDHDFHRRIWQKTGRRPIYMPMHISSPSHFGAQRRERTGINKVIFEHLCATRKLPDDFVDFVLGRGYKNNTVAISQSS